MPFDRESAAAYGRKGGKHRWRGKDPSTNRDKALMLKLTPREYSVIEEKAATAGLSKVELVVRAVSAFEAEPPQASPT